MKISGEWPTWPEIEITFGKAWGDHTVSVKTQVRKQDSRGIWYVTRAESWTVTEHGLHASTLELQRVIFELNRAVLSIQLFSRIDRMIVNLHGSPVWKVDRDQRSEAQRLFPDYEARFPSKQNLKDIQLIRDDRRFSAQDLLCHYYEKQ
jgi:hypothetical protein